MYPPQNPPPFPPPDPNQYQPPYPPPQPPPQYPPQPYPPQYPPQYPAQHAPQYPAPYPPQYPPQYAAPHATPAAAADPMKRLSTRPDIYAAGLAIVAFFMPWFSAGGDSDSGYDCAEGMRLLSGAGAGSEATTLMVLLYGIPVSAGFAIVANFTAARRPRWASIVSALVVAAAIIYMHGKAGENSKKLFDAATFGYYATLAAGASMFVLAFKGER